VNPVTEYQPVAKPGWRAPHFWANNGATRFSSVDLFQRNFVLLTGANGDVWKEAAKSIQLRGPVGFTAYSVGQTSDIIPESDFETLYGIEGSGVVLVRPDGHVAFRVRTRREDPGAALRDALRRTLTKSDPKAVGFSC
jgi:hypothetical protein